jgi:hypothetical protein
MHPKEQVEKRIQYTRVTSEKLIEWLRECAEDFEKAGEPQQAAFFRSFHEHVVSGEHYILSNDNNNKIEIYARKGMIEVGKQTGEILNVRYS